MSRNLRKNLRERLAREKGYYVYPPGVRSRFALIYPNTYFVGMSNLGLHIVYELLNKRSDTACERFFLPAKDEIAEYEKSKTPLLSAETQTALGDFPLIGFAVSFELDYFNVLEILRLGKVKLKADERGDGDPIVIAGGPCATFNPEPLSPFVDAFIIGEGEETVNEFMDAYYAAKAAVPTRRELLLALSKVEGVYVPSLYAHHYDESGKIARIERLDGAKEKVKRRYVKNLDDYPAHTVISTDDTEFKLYLIETARGCGRHCRFCMAGYCFRRPRNRSLSSIKEQALSAKPLGKRIGLMGAAISDYPQIDELCDFLTENELKMSVASFRADSVTEKLVNALSKSGMRTITVAPEAGSEKMRAVINKGIEEEHIYRAIELGAAAGIRRFRLYMMIGLPYEEESDVAAICSLVENVRDFLRDKAKGARLIVSVNPFVPKPFTPFERVSMADEKYISKSYKLLQKAFKSFGDVELLTESLKEAIVQGVLSRGDRRIGEVLFAAYEAGGIKAFRKSMKELKLSEDFYLYREREENEILPWSVLDMGVEEKYFSLEAQKAKNGEKTIPCFDGCRRCGVCKE